ncbi:MAG: arsenic resistance protein [Desulfurococcales archaeon]|nr:arsenic resistance protein [Desulfurococcales archaeon]
MVSVVRIASHLRRYLLLYVLLVIIIALPIGYYNADRFKAHEELVKNTILFLALGTLLPSMIQLRAEKIGGELRFKWRETLIALIIVFLIVPVIAIFFATYINDRTIGIGYIAANSVPASSASVAYVMLAEGNIELATVLVILSIIIALFAAPLYVGLYAQSVHINLPITVLAESVAIALLIPLILGQLIRYILIVRRARKLAVDKTVVFDCKEKAMKGIGAKESYSIDKEVVKCLENKIMTRIKPVLSIWTITFMLTLVSLLIANKARLLISKPDLAIYIISAQLGIYTIIILSLLVASILLKMKYRDHMAAAFISLTKNESVAAAMAVLAIGPTAAIPAALIPAIQPVIAILYISSSPIIKRILKDMGDKY